MQRLRLLKAFTPTLTSLTALLACGSFNEATDQVDEPLLGELSITNCDPKEALRLTNGMTLGRKVSRSSAFLECLTEAVVNGITIGSSAAGPAHWGPYAPCPVANGDPMANETPRRQAARLASASAARLPVELACNECGGLSAKACTNEIPVDGTVLHTGWKTVGSVDFNAFLSWHEAAHGYGYQHGKDNNFGCGYVDSSGEPIDDGYLAAPNITGKCMQEVIKEGAGSVQCAAKACASNEVALPKFFGRWDSISTCECVPDRWPGENEAGDRFGSSFAVGRFDGDPFPDLAVGAFGETAERGAVYLFRGSLAGLRFWKRLTQAQFGGIDYDLGTSTFPVGQNPNDQFGYALAAGDINADGFDDLLVGAPGKGSNAGAVYLIPGSMVGPDIDHVEWIDQTDTGGAIEAGDRFGSSIVVGNFDGNSTVDFAVGAPAEIASGFSGGAISIHGGRAGAAGSSTFQSNDTLWTLAENGAEFGFSMATADTDGDGRDELVVGAPGSNSNNGRVEVLGKDASAWTNTQTLTRTATRFGSSLAAGDFISDSNADVAVGAGEDQGNKGSVFTFRGTSTTVVYAQTITANETDHFGEGLAIGNLVGGSKRDLIVGLPGESFGGGPAEGQIYIYGATSSTTLGSAHTVLSQSDFFDGGADDVVLPPEHLGNDHFGSSIIVYNQVGQLAAKAGVVAGAYGDTVDGAKSGAAFVYFGIQADRKLDQVTMRHADSLPYVY